MKNIKKIFFANICFFTGILLVYAAPSYSFYTGASSIEVGSSVTATIQLKNVASWNVKIQSSGSTSGCTTSFADATSNAANTTKYLSVTCRSTSTGVIGFTVTGDATSQDGSTTNISATKTVSVKAAREKDTNNYLKSIGVTGYTLTPEFNQDTMEYTVDVPATVNKVTIEAATASNYATLTGTGEVEVNEGANTFEIKVTSETGVERIYKITVNVKDENPIKVKIGNSEYTVMKNVKNIEVPSTYEATTIKINDFDIPAFYSSTTKYTLVSVKDSKGQQHFAIYNSDKNTYELYNENKSNQLLLYIMSIPEEKQGFSKTKITINEQSYDCLKSNIGDTYIIYAMDVVTGKKDYYIYDKENNTYAIYKEDMAKNYEEQIKKYQIVLLGFAGGLVLCFLIILILLFRKPKNKKGNREKTIKEIKQEPLKEEIQKVKEEPVKIEEQKQEKKSKKKGNKNSPKKNETIEKRPNPPTNLSKEEAIKKVDDVTKIIEEYEKTVQMDKKQIQEAQKNAEEKQTEETMYDIFENKNKKKKKKRK